MIRIRDLSRVRIERVQFPSASGMVSGLVYSGGSSSTCVVLAHGYSSSKHNVDPLAFYLATEGVLALAFDFQGHKMGASSLPLRRAEDLCENVLDAVAYAHTIADVGQVVAAGHSMGAAPRPVRDHGHRCGEGWLDLVHRAGFQLHRPL